MHSTKDEIGFHNLMNSVRKHRGVSLEKLGYGLYSDVMMHYIEAGERLPDYLMRNRIMDRLGISAEDYSDYVSSFEFTRYKKRNELMEAIETKQTDRANEILDYLLESCDVSKKIEYQLLLGMKAKILMLEQRPFFEIASAYKCAIDVTMPNIDVKKIEEYNLASEEIFLLISWVIPSYYAGVIVLNEAEQVLIRILKIIEQSFFQEITKCKIYPMAVVKLYDLYVNEGIFENVVICNRISQYAERAIELLRKNYRLYYIMELLEIRERLNCVDDKSKRWIYIFSKIYDEYEEDYSMDNNCYIYKNSFVISIGEVIQSRREMLGITKKELAEGICVPKTIERIEKGINSPQQIVLKGIMQKLGVNGDYCRTDIQTNNYSLIRNYKLYLNAMNRKNRDAIVFFHMLMADMEKNDSNQQELIRIINLAKIRDKEITTDRFVTNIKRALLHTKIDIANIKGLSGYFTNIEMQCIYNIACRGSNIKDGKMVADFLADFCEELKDDRGEMLDYSTYELIMSWYANKQGNEKKYSESSKISHNLIKDSLRQCRVATIAKELYNIAWNDAKQNGDYNNEAYLNKLEAVKSLYEYCLRPDKVQFITNKICIHHNGGDWT